MRYIAFDSRLITLHHDDARRIGLAARKITPTGTDRLTVTLDASDRAELERLSDATDRSLAWIVREALREYLEKSRRSAAKTEGA